MEFQKHNHDGFNSEKIKIYNVIPTYVMTTAEITNYLSRKSINGDAFNVYNSTTSESCQYVMINNSWVKTSGGSSAVCGKMYAGSQQAIADATAATVNITSTTSAEGITADTTNKRFEITQAGFYQVIGQVSYASPVADKSYNAFIYKNTTLMTRMTAHSSNNDSISCVATDIMSLAVGDYIYLKAGQNSGSSVNTRAGDDDTYLLIHKL